MLVEKGLGLHDIEEGQMALFARDAFTYHDISQDISMSSASFHIEDCMLETHIAEPCG
jgi:hypothetical protein